MYNTRNTAVYSLVGRLTAAQVEKHINSEGLGKLVCVTTVGVNHTGIEYTIDRSVGHHDYMLLFVERGEVQIEIDADKMTLGSNDMIIVPPSIPYRYTLLYGSNTRWVHFIGAELLDNFGIKCNYVYKIQEIIEFNRLLRQCLETINGASLIKENMLSIYAAELFVAVAENDRMFEEESANGIVKATNAMKQSLASTVSIREYAEIAGYNQKAFTKKFKEVTGLNPKEYIMNLRMERICEEIMNSSMSIIDIALNSGFNSYEYFLKVFKKKTGFTPSQYRNKFR